MKVGFDLDGVLDRPVLATLLRTLLSAGVEVHIITGTFDESDSWQGPQAKREKLARLNIPYRESISPVPGPGHPATAVFHCLYAADEHYGLEYRLRDLGMRKGALCEKLGITLFLDDSEIYAKMIPLMSGGTTVLHVR